MNRVFSDTAYYQALFNRADRRHQAAAKTVAHLRVDVVTTEYVLVELGALMSAGRARTSYVKFVERLRTDPSTTVVPASPGLFDEGFSLFRARPDKEWSITDCISFIVMKTRGIQQVLTFDHHFEQAGFQIVCLT